MKIINLTQHAATPEQKAEGVIDITDPEERKTLSECLHFDSVPDTEELNMRAEALADLACTSLGYAMIGGAPYLMASLELALLKRGIQAAYAFSKRESVEEAQPDGSVRKTAVFRHLGFVWVE